MTFYHNFLRLYRYLLSAFRATLLKQRISSYEKIIPRAIVSSSVTFEYFGHRRKYLTSLFVSFRFSTKLQRCGELRNLSLIECK